MNEINKAINVFNSTVGSSTENARATADISTNLQDQFQLLHLLILELETMVVDKPQQQEISNTM